MYMYLHAESNWLEWYAYGKNGYFSRLKKGIWMCLCYVFYVIFITTFLRIFFAALKKNSISGAKMVMDEQTLILLAQAHRNFSLLKK